MLKYSSAVKSVFTHLEDAVVSTSLLQNWDLHPSSGWDSADAHMALSSETILEWRPCHLQGHRPWRVATSNARPVPDP